MSITIETKRSQDLVSFLQMSDFQVEELADGVYQATRGEELPVYLKVSDKTLFFEVDLGNISQIADQSLYFEILDQNTEILPVSFGINNTNPRDPRLVILESRNTDELSEGEVLGVFDALELAVDKAESILAKKLS